MNKLKINALNEYIEVLQSGETPEKCVAELPENAGEFHPLLHIAKVIDKLHIDNIPTDAKNISRVKVLAHAINLQTSGIQSNRLNIFLAFVQPFVQLKRSYAWIRFFPGKLLISLGMASLFILFSGGLVITSAKSIPGDTLYPIKLAVEDIKYYFTYDVQTRHLYEDSFTEQRVEEVKSLLVIRRTQYISFEGSVLSKDGPFLDVGGIKVEITPKTLIAGGLGGLKIIEPGSIVEVEGSTISKGWVEASEIHIRQYQFIGSVDKIGRSYWIISGIKLATPVDAQIDMGIKLGDDVLVNVHSEDSGLYAVSIQRMIQSVTTPSYTPSPTNSDDSDETFIDHEEFIYTGILSEISTNYWIIGANIYFITSTTHINEDIRVGDNIRVKYEIEENGSFTAIEIEKADQTDEDNVASPSETPEPTDNDDHVTTTTEPTENDADEVGEKTPQPSVTPEITETPQPTETPEDK